MREALPLTGTQYTLRAGGYHAVVTSLGATLRVLEFEGRAILLGHDADTLPESAHGQLLAPWVNRLRDGRWTWRGRELRVPVDEPDRGNSANHGLVRWAGWTVAVTRDDAVELEYELAPTPGYPFRLGFHAQYSLDAAHGLTTSLRVVNRSAGAAPVALGGHPYLRPLGGGLIDDVLVRIPSSTRLLVDEYGTPTAEHDTRGTEFDFRDGRRIGSTSLNNAFRVGNGLADTKIVLRDEIGEVTVEMSKQARWVQLYTADALSPGESRRAVAVEPLTAPPSALTSGRDLTVLSPGADTELSWRVSATVHGVVPPDTLAP